MSEEADVLRQIRRELTDIKQVLGQPLVGGMQTGGEGTTDQWWIEQIGVLNNILDKLTVLQKEFHAMFYHGDVLSKKNNLAHAIWALKERLAPK